MDIELKESFLQMKSRKNSYSTIPSPNLDNQNNDLSNFKTVYKHKKLRKLKRNKTLKTLKNQEKNQKDQRAQKQLVKQNKMILFHLVKDLTKSFNFHIDTYLVCLKIINVMKFDGQSYLCHQVAATVCFMVQKVHESYKIQFPQIHHWTGCTLSKQQYVETQAAILQGLKYQIPLIDPQWNEIQIQQQINRIEKNYQF